MGRRGARCQACGKVLDGGVEGLCAPCEKQFKTIYGDETALAEKAREVTMGTKKTTKKATTHAKTNGAGRRVHQAEDLEPEAETAEDTQTKAAAVINDVATEDVTPKMRARAKVVNGAAIYSSGVTKVADNEDPEPDPESDPRTPDEAFEDDLADTGAPPPAPPSKPNAFGHLERNNALRTLKSVVKRAEALEQIDYAKWGVAGIGGAIHVLRSALANMEAASVRSASIVVGSKVRVREKLRGSRYVGLEAGEAVDLKVVQVRAGGLVGVDTSSGARIFFPARDLEIQP